MDSQTNEIEKMVNHPQHYGGENNPYEVIKVIEALEMDFHIGNTFKYIVRAGKKLLLGMVFTFMIESMIVYGADETRLTMKERVLTVLVWPVMLLYLILELLKK